MFRLSIKSHYALKVVFQLALAYEKHGPVQSRVIGDAQDIPQAYLEQVLMQLRKAGVIQSIRGKQGGYELATHPDQVSVLDVLSCIDGEIVLAGGYDSQSVLAHFWQDMADDITLKLSKTMADLVAEHQRLNQVAMYSI